MADADWEEGGNTKAAPTSYNNNNYDRYKDRDDDRSFKRRDDQNGDDKPRFRREFKPRDDNDGGERRGGGGGGRRFDNDKENGGGGRRFDRNNAENGDGGDRRGGGGRRFDRNNDVNGDGGDRRGGRRDRNEDGENGGERRGRRRDGEDGDHERKGSGDRGDKPREIYIPPEPTNDEAEMFGAGIKTGINFDKYDAIQVNVSENISLPMGTFAEAQLRALLLTNLEKSGYTKPTPIQRYAIPTILSGKDLMGCAQTGSGKTAAFLLPMLHKLMNDFTWEPSKPKSIIVSPTRELAIQIFNEARKFALGSPLKVAIAYGGTAVRYQNETILKGCHVLVATPGRLNDFVERGWISLDAIQFVVLDEADRMLDMGFLPAVEKLMDHPTMVKTGERQTLMFSATFPKAIQELAGKFLKDYGFISVGIVGGACTDVKQVFMEVPRFDKRKKLKEIIDETGDPQGTLVFVETQRSTDFLASFLSETEFPTTSIHGGREQRERETALRDFTSGKMKILVATSVAARGLDIAGVKHVINFDLPKSIDDYVHRIGRTGRLGNQGRATSFFDPTADAAIAPDLVRILKQANEEIPSCLESFGEGGSYSQSTFGASDIRGGQQRGRSAPAPLEVEEEW